MKSFFIRHQQISSLHKPYIIAEISANHLGSKERALRLIDAALDAGADAVKIQTYTPDCLTISCQKSDFLIQKGLWKGKTLYELYQEGMTPFEWHKDLFHYADSKGITLFSSPFSAEAIDLLESLKAPAYKIASFECVDLALIRKAAATKKPLLISTGLAKQEEVEEAVKAALSMQNTQIALLHCVCGYPTPLECSNLWNIERLKQFFPECLIGLSDHTEGYEIPFLATGLGACIIEKHLTLSRTEGGLDAAFSLEPQEFKLLVQKVNLAFKALGNKQSLDLQRSSSEEIYRYGLRSIYVVKSLKKGDEITKEHIRVIRPGYGLPPKYYPQVLGQKILKDIDRGTPLSWNLIESAKKNKKVL